MAEKFLIRIATALGAGVHRGALAWSRWLESLAGIRPTKDTFVVGDGTEWGAKTGSAARTSLGLGALATLDTVDTAQIEAGAVGNDEVEIGSLNPNRLNQAFGPYLMGHASDAVPSPPGYLPPADVRTMLDTPQGSGAAGRLTRWGAEDQVVASEIPDPGLLLPTTVGITLHEDFFVRPSAGPWDQISMGSGWTVSHPSVAEEGVGGVYQINLTGSAGAGMTLSMPGTVRLTPGLICYAKTRQTSGGASLIQYWSGLWEHQNVLPSGQSGVGWRVIDGGNYEGITRSGGVQNTRSFGFGISNGTWRYLGFEVLADGSIQFFRLDLSVRGAWVRTDVGSPITSDVPDTETLRPIALGAQKQTSVDRISQIDAFDLGGRTRR